MFYNANGDFGRRQRIIMTESQNLIDNTFSQQAKNISRIFEQDSRRFNRALSEEEEAKAQ